MPPDFTPPDSPLTSPLLAPNTNFSTCDLMSTRPPHPDEPWNRQQHLDPPHHNSFESVVAAKTFHVQRNAGERRTKFTQERDCGRWLRNGLRPSQASHPRLAARGWVITPSCTRGIAICRCSLSRNLRISPRRMQNLTMCISTARARDRLGPFLPPGNV